MNPTEIIPQDALSAPPVPSADHPGSGFSRTPSEKSPRPQPSTKDEPAAAGVPADVTNLAIAAGLLSIAFLLFWMGSYLANHVAIRALVASFGTFALVWVLYRLRVFQRPHGGLVAAGAVALFAAALPFVERGFQKLDHVAKTGLGGESTKPSSESAAPLPVPTRETAPPAPATPAATAPSTPPPAPEDEVIRDLPAPELDPAAKKIITVLRDAVITLDGKKYRIHEGSRFPYTELKDELVTFQANGQDATIHLSVVRFTGKSQETPMHITQLAQFEAMRRYPALGVKGSEENQLYLARVAELKEEFPDLLKDPQWPLVVAVQLASDQGWKRADQPSDDTAPPIPPAEGEKTDAKLGSPLPPTDPALPLAPAAPASPTVPPIPSAPSDIPQEAPPTAK